MLLLSIKISLKSCMYSPTFLVFVGHTCNITSSPATADHPQRVIISHKIPKLQIDPQYTATGQL